MSKLYQIRHVTRYFYENEITENVMEVRKCPVNRPTQRCMSFNLETKPRATLFQYEEFTGNIVHSFDVPQRHKSLVVTAETVIEVKEGKPIPDKVDNDCWDRLASMEEEGDCLDYLLPSRLVEFTELLQNYFGEVGPRNDEDPLTFLKRLNGDIAQGFEYVPKSTQVDSSIDEALRKKQGVCQDFAHIMLGVSRMAKIPARYVSGYLFRCPDGNDRSSSEASHAWIEAFLPGLGWIGFDPTNNIMAGDRHIVTSIGRDYGDVPPTRGVFRGMCASELSVAVQVNAADSPHLDDDFKRMDESDLSPEIVAEEIRKEMAEQAQQ
ncbi:MAG TPA: transglutaminase family protein [Phycisphaerales bacterium]|nr:transglutaminase family protein [Phycisphaerales bacterium]